MKFIFAFFAVLFLFVENAYGQFVRTPFKSWKFQAISVTFEPYLSQELKGLSTKTMLDLVKNGSVQFDETNYSEVVIDSYSPEGTIAITGRLQRAISSRMEENIELGVVFHISPEVMIHHYNDSGLDEYYGLCLLNEQINFKGSYLVRYRLGYGVTLYGGPTIDFGTTFNERFLTFETENGLTPHSETSAKTLRFITYQAGFGIEKSFADRVSLFIGRRFGAGRQLNGDIAIGNFGVTHLGIALLFKNKTE